MEDIAPSLLEHIREDFARRIKDSAQIQALHVKIVSGGASYTDAEEYAYLVGEALSQSFGKFITPDSLPDGRLYYNIADRVLRPMLEEDYSIVSDAAVTVQKFLNEKAKIGIKPQSVAVNTDRIDGIIDKVSNADAFEDVAWVLDAPVKNFSMNVVDETIRKNVEFHGKAGLKPRIVRKAERKCCKWCSALAGEYDYPDVPHDVYRRHKNCRCTVEYDPRESKRQNVHSKQWTDDADRAKIEKRKTVGLQKERPMTERGMANGPRRGRLTRVSAEEENKIREWANELGIPEYRLSFNTGSFTSFDDDMGIIHIRGDVFPSEFAENFDSILNARCAIAHEYYGHYMNHPSIFPVGDWRDEFRASYRAALDTPNLSDRERQLLMIDAFERARNAGISLNLNKEARRMLYGAD